MRVDIYEWSMQIDNWVHKRWIEVSQEKINKVLSKPYQQSFMCYKLLLEDGRVIYHVNNEFFEREV